VPENKAEQRDENGYQLRHFWKQSRRKSVSHEKREKAGKRTG